MSEYPEALLEKVAVAIFEWDIEEHDEPKPTWGGLNEAQRNVWRSGAVAALGVVGLREETFQQMGRATEQVGPVQHRYATDWEIRD